MAEFLNGHLFFTRRLQDYSGIKPIATHLTYQFGDTADYVYGACLLRNAPPLFSFGRVSIHAPRPRDPPHAANFPAASLVLYNVIASNGLRGFHLLMRSHRVPLSLSHSPRTVVGVARPRRKAAAAS
jgi:hypothetical protein